MSNYPEAKAPEKAGAIRQRHMQEVAISGLLFWSIGSGVIRKGVLLMRWINCF
jgi:hypothetical protein